MHEGVVPLHSRTDLIDGEERQGELLMAHSGGEARGSPIQSPVSAAGYKLVSN